MQDQELFKQLHNLSKMKPDASWKDSQRSIMLSQINAGSLDPKKESLFLDLFKLPFAYMQSFSQPLIATFLVVFLFLTGGFVGLKAAQDTKPGDSLYLAKIVGEKTQLALAFTEKKKAQLGIGFAVRRVEEIKQIIAEENKEDSDDKVDQLVADFKKEIKAAKLRIAKISTTKTNDSIKENTNNNLPDGDEADNVAGEDDSDINIFSAGFDKTEKGLEISDNNSDNNDIASKIIIDKTLVDGEDTKLEASTSKEVASSSPAEEVQKTETASPESILQEASDLLQVESYGDALDTLDDAGTAVDESFDTGEVLGVEESIQIETATDSPVVDEKVETSTGK